MLDEPVKDEDIHTQLITCWQADHLLYIKSFPLFIFKKKTSSPGLKGIGRCPYTLGINNKEAKLTEPYKIIGIVRRQQKSVKSSKTSNGLSATRHPDTNTLL